MASTRPAATTSIAIAMATGTPMMTALMLLRCQNMSFLPQWGRLRGGRVAAFLALPGHAEFTIVHSACLIALAGAQRDYLLAAIRRNQPAGQDQDRGQRAGPGRHAPAARPARRRQLSAMAPAAVSLARLAVDRLADQVGVAVVPGVLLHHVHEHPPRRRAALAAPGSVRGAQRRGLPLAQPCRHP